jgi:hypothetical protein
VLARATYATRRRARISRGPSGPAPLRVAVLRHAIACLVEPSGFVHVSSPVDQKRDHKGPFLIDWRWSESSANEALRGFGPLSLLSGKSTGNSRVITCTQRRVVPFNTSIQGLTAPPNKIGHSETGNIRENFAWHQNVVCVPLEHAAYRVAALSHYLRPAQTRTCLKWPKIRSPASYLTQISAFLDTGHQSICLRETRTGRNRLSRKPSKTRTECLLPAVARARFALFRQRLSASSYCRVNECLHSAPVANRRKVQPTRPG